MVDGQAGAPTMPPEAAEPRDSARMA